MIQSFRSSPEVVLLCLCCLAIQDSALGQSGRKREQSSPSEELLEKRLQKAEESLVAEYKEVANELYKQGNKEKTMKMLQRLKQLSPNLEGLNDQIRSMKEELLQQNVNEIEIDTRKSWQLVGDVVKDKTFRVAAKGEMKLTLMATVGVQGLATGEDSPDYLYGLPLGCLIGVIVVNDKPGKPFAVNAELEHKPKKSGRFFVKMNVPPATKCSGKVKLQVSGSIRSGKP